MPRRLTHAVRWDITLNDGTVTSFETLEVLSFENGVMYCDDPKLFIPLASIKHAVANPSE